MQPPDVEHIYCDGRIYDRQHESFMQDLPFWQRLAATHGGPILELACGTGRVAIPLAQDGHQVTGLDAAETMLREARRKSSALGVRVEWIHGDMRAFDLDGRCFQLITIPFNALCHLYEPEEMEAFLGCVRRHLGPEGRFVIDVFNPKLQYLVRDPDEPFGHAEFEDPEGRGRVTVTERCSYDRATQINHITVTYHHGWSGEEISDLLRMRIYYPRELDLWLRQSGLCILEKLGDNDQSPFTTESPKQLVICGR